MTDIRVQLENELDSLQEEQVESWIQRCFEACDPRYDSDWLSGMFELANMQFPDNYEVRSACSKATILEARRLSTEGDVKEAMARLEQLLEADPYCTEGFELLEELSKPQEPVQPPSIAAEPAVVAMAPPPPDELSSMFADEELFQLDNDLPLAATPPTPEPTPEPAPEIPASAISAPAQNAASAPVPEPWDELWTLPRPVSEGIHDPHYLQGVVAMSEKMRTVGRPDYALRILVDHRQELQESPAWREHVKSTLIAWVNKLVESDLGQQAAQVSAWGARVLQESDIQELATNLKSRFGLMPPASAPDSSEGWKSRLTNNPGDMALLEEIWQSFHNDRDGMLMLFRQAAVENPGDSRQILNLGWAYLKSGTPALALVHTQRALKLAPTRRAYGILAETYDSLGQPQLKEAALKSLQETPSP